MFCTNCGKQINDDAKFCRYCGQTFSRSDKATKLINKEVLESVKNIKKPDLKLLKIKRSINTKVIIIGVLVLLIAVAGLVLFRSFGSKEEQWVVSKHLSYDKEGNILDYYVYDYDPDGRNTNTSYYDKGGNLLNYYEQAFDSSGLLSEKIGYNSDGNLEYIESYEHENEEYPNLITSATVYDKDGNIIGNSYYDLYGKNSDSWYLNDDGTIEEYHIYEFDNFGNRIKETVLNPDRSFQYEKKTENEYDPKGNLIKTVLYDKENQMTGYRINEYDENNNKIKETSYSPADKINSWYIYDYDTDNNKIKETYYNSDNTMYSYTEYEYDSDGNTKRSMSYDETGKLKYGTRYEYDSKGRQIERYSIKKDGTEYLSYESVYNEKDQYVGYTYYSEDNNYTRYGYEYDNNGKTTKYTREITGEEKTTIREYEYECDHLLKSTDYDYNGNIIEYTENVYDENGSRVSSINYDKDGNVTGTVKNEYDSNNNLIRSVKEGTCIGLYESLTKDYVCDEYEYIQIKVMKQKER